MSALRFKSLWLLFLLPILGQAAELKLAVASNFRATMLSIAKHYEASTENTLSISYASTGKHTAQIINGAPFDVLLAADSERPILLVEKGHGVAKTLNTYAIGRLALWSPIIENDKALVEKLRSGDFNFLSIANPQHAPYGLAAKQVLQAQSLWQPLPNKIVRGENINQAFQYVRSGNAQLGFIAYSQIVNTHTEGSYWLVPQTLHSPITQQLVALNKSAETLSFIEFMRSEVVMQIIQQSGYDLAK